MKIEFVVVFFC